LSRGRPLDGAPGWHVIERRRPSGSRPALPQDPSGSPPAENRRFTTKLAAYLIAATAVVVAVLQLLFPLGPGLPGAPAAHQLLSPAPSPPAQTSADAGKRTRSEDAPASPRSEIADPEIGADRASTSALDALIAEVVALESAAPPAEQAEPSESVAPSAIRVFIHHGVDPVDRERAVQLAAFLQSTGFDVVDTRRVESEIERPSVRYFFERDREASRRLVEAMGRFFLDRPDLTPDTTTDFSHYTPKPRAGSVEVWVPPARRGRTPAAAS